MALTPLAMLIAVDGAVSSLNAAAERLLGYPAAELIGAPLAGIVAPEHQHAFAAAFQHAITGGEVASFEGEVCTQVGGRARLQLRLTPVRDAQGGISGVLAIGCELLAEQQEAGFQLLFRANPRPMWVYDVATLRFLEVNDAATLVYGYTRAEFLAMTLEDIRPHEELPALHALTRRTDLPPRLTARTRHRDRDGAILQVEVTGHELIYAGRAARLVVVEDITERLAAERSLRESEERHRRAFEEAGIGIAHADLEGRVLEVNDQTCRILGRSREQLLGHSLREFTHPDDVPVIETQIPRLLTGEAPALTVQLRCLHAGGHIVWLDVTLTRVAEPDGTPRFTVAMMHDVTERRRAGQALVESERRYRALMEASTDAILVMDDRLRYVDANPAALALLGYSRDELLRMAVHDLTPEDEHDAITAAFAALRAGRSNRARRRVLRKDGSLALVEMQSTRVPDGRFLATARDLTPVLEAERQRALLVEREAETAAAQEADRLKSDLINVVSHELRTPLAAIKGFASTLLQFEDSLESDEQRDFIGEIDRAADRLGRLVEDLLLAGRLSSGTLAVRSEPVALAGILREAVEQVQRVTGRTITVRIAARLPLVRGDQLRLSQVAGNLLSNAVKFSPEGGPVSLSAAAAPGPDGRPGVRFVVRDQGIGIDPAELPRVFDRFFRASSARALEIGGTGLGLPICNEIVRAQHGTIDIDSALGEGTTVTVWLPALEEPGSAAS